MNLLQFSFGEASRSRFSTILAINVLFAVVLSLGTASLLSHHLSRRSLIQQTQANLQRQSRELSLLLGEQMLIHIERLEAVASEDAVTSQLLEQPLETSAINTADNPSIQTLRDLSRRFQGYDTLFITDRNGTVVAATTDLNNSSQANKTWWKAIWNEGAGNIYIGQPLFNEAQQVYTTVIAVPVYEGSDVIGTVHARCQLSPALTFELNTVDIDTSANTNPTTLESIGSRLYISPDEYLGDRQIETTAPLSVEGLSTLPFAPIDYNDSTAFVSASPVHTLSEMLEDTDILATRAIAVLPWHILTYQDSQSALSPLAGSARIATIMVVGTIVIAILLGYVLAQIISRPMQTLIHTAQKIRSDTVTSSDLAQLEQIAEEKSFVGQLASAFIDMSLVVVERQKNLSDEIATLQEAQADTGAHQANELELAYYEALRRKSAWIRQQAVDETTTETAPKTAYDSLSS